MLRVIDRTSAAMPRDAIVVDDDGVPVVPAAVDATVADELTDDDVAVPGAVRVVEPSFVSNVVLPSLVITLPPPFMHSCVVERIDHQYVRLVKSVSRAYLSFIFC